MLGRIQLIPGSTGTAVSKGTQDGWKAQRLNQRLCGAAPSERPWGSVRGPRGPLCEEGVSIFNQAEARPSQKCKSLDCVLAAWFCSCFRYHGYFSPSNPVLEQGNCYFKRQAGPSRGWLRSIIRCVLSSSRKVGHKEWKLGHVTIK